LSKFTIGFIGRQLQFNFSLSTLSSLWC